MQERAFLARPRSDDRGAAAVEFALLFPLFLVICFGTISGGILFSDKLALTQGAREGARYGATLPYTAGQETSFLTQVRDSAEDADQGQIGTGSASYCVSLRTSTGSVFHMKQSDSAAQSGKCPNVSAADLPTVAHVAVQVSKPSGFNLLLYKFDVAIGSVSTARFEGTS